MKERVRLNEVRGFIRQLLGQITQLPPDEILDSSAIDGALKMESVAFVELQVAIEEQYQIELDPVEIVERNELGAIIDYVYELSNRPRSS